MFSVKFALGAHEDHGRISHSINPGDRDNQFHEDHRQPCLSSVERSRTVSNATIHATTNTNPRSPVHPTSPQYERRWQAEDYVRLDEDQGCRSKILQLGLQEGRCGLEQTVCWQGNWLEEQRIDIRAELERSHLRNSSELSQSFKTLHSTRFQHGSSIDNAISLMARTLRFWQIAWKANFVRIWND